MQYSHGPAFFKHLPKFFQTSPSVSPSAQVLLAELPDLKIIIPLHPKLEFISSLWLLGYFIPKMFCLSALRQRNSCNCVSSGLFFGRKSIRFPLLFNHPPTWVGFCREYCGNYHGGKTQPFPAVSGPSCFRYEMVLKAHLSEQEEHMELLYPTKHSGNHEGGSSRLQNTAWNDGQDASKGWSRNKFLYSQMFVPQVSNKSTGTRMTPSCHPSFPGGPFPFFPREVLAVGKESF